MHMKRVLVTMDTMLGKNSQQRVSESRPSEGGERLLSFRKPLMFIDYCFTFKVFGSISNNMISSSMEATKCNSSAMLRLLIDLNLWFICYV
jgi:hypothetical protein